MALLRDLEGRTLELFPVDYEFTEPHRAAFSDYDANWLQVRLKVDDPHAELSFDSAAPALLTWSFLSLGSWLRTVGSGEVEAGWYYPSDEPNLAFAWQPDGEGIILRVLLSQEFSPIDSFTEYELRLRCRQGDLTRFAHALESDVARFPIRTWGDDPSTERIAQRYKQTPVRL